MAKKSTTKTKSLFDHIKQITAVQDPLYWNSLSDEDRKSWSTYMVIRFLSMEPAWIDVVNELQKYVHKLEPAVVYELLIGIIPKSNKFLKYTKPSNKTNVYPEWLVELMGIEYVCSKTNAVDYLDILLSLDNGVESVKSMCTKYGVQADKLKGLKL